VGEKERVGVLIFEWLGGLWVEMEGRGEGRCG